MKLKLDINSVAVKQLTSAIWMYAYDYDEVAVHTVAGAAFEIYTKRLELSTFNEDVKKYIKPEKAKEFIALWDKPYNFFKHGEYNYNKLEYIEYDEEIVELIIYLAAEANLAGEEKFRLSSANVYKFFYSLKHPELFDQEFYNEILLKEMHTRELDPESVNDKGTLKVWLNNIGTTFLNGSESPFRNITPR